MWLRLGDNELVNMDRAVSVRKGPENTLEIHFPEAHQLKVIPFRSDGERDYAFDLLVNNLVKMRMAME